VTGLLAYEPRRLATLAAKAQAAADELTTVAAEEPFTVDAIRLAHGIATDLDEVLVMSLRAVLSSTSMTGWNGLAVLLTVDQLIDVLNEQAAEPSAPFVLGEGDLSIATVVTPAEPVQWLHDVNPGCVRFAGGTYVGGGYVADHRDVRYPIVVPRVETDEGAVYTADRHVVAAGEPSVATLGGSDPGWEIVGWATGVARFQEAPSLDEAAWGFLAGTTGLVGTLPPNGGLAHIAVSPNGPPHLTDEPPTPGPVVAPSSAIAPDASSRAPGEVLEGGAALALSAAQGGVVAGALDNQTERAYQVIFEENGDGRRRARIQTFTLAHDGAGGVVIIPEHVYVNGEGELTSQTISYGSPYPADAVHLAAATDDVADFAFSGEEPITYPVAQAVFP
jgi:hypothetical protein